MNCSTNLCDRPLYSKGMCSKCYRKAYYQANIDKWKNQVRNKEKQAIYARTYLEKNRDRRRDSKRKRRALERNAAYDGWTENDVLERDNHTCQICFEPLNGDFHIDHIKALWAGGSHLFENVRATHSSCNISRNTHDEENGI